MIPKNYSAKKSCKNRAPEVTSRADASYYFFSCFALKT